MRKALVATTAASLLAATVGLSTQAGAGHNGCWAPTGGALIAGSVHGRYGRYHYGYCGGNGYGDPAAYYPPAYYEYEPAYDGYPGPVYNPNVYYDYPTYRRVDYGAYPGPHRAYIRPCCRPYW